MIVFFILLVIIYFVNSKINLKGLNKDYLDKNNTTVINGIFVIIVFFSHFLSYNQNLNILDEPLKFIVNNLGQLMVTTFLFYSGFGIYEQIKKNKEKYIDSFFKKRFLNTFFNFFIAILLFLLLTLLLNIKYSFKTILLSFIGWESIGNSNWYMFAIFSLYLIVLFSFKIFKDNKTSLIVITILSLIYIIVVNIFKDSFWIDTILCFSGGMWYSYFKDKIDNFIMKNHKNYFIILSINFVLLFLLYLNRSNIYIHNVLSLSFVFLINLINMKITSNNKILLFFGRKVFWIYILQRIPMIIFQGKLNIYLYFALSFSITIFLTLTMNKILTLKNKNQ